MRPHPAAALCAMLLLSGAGAAPGVSPVVRPNPNLERAGVLRGGVLTVALEAKQGRWYLDGSARRPMAIEVFAEAGKAPTIPGPLLRVPAGTEIRLSVRNSLSRPLTFVLPAELRGGDAQGRDSAIIAPGAVGQLSTRATVPGNYMYLGRTPNRASLFAEQAGLLAGALVVDEATTPPRDRVFVIMETADSAFNAYADTADLNKPHDFSQGRFIFTINGRSWPNTEHLTANVGDTLHWRVINASADVHPMHLHGFYYRIDGMSGPLVDAMGPRPRPGQMAVTQLLSPFAGMSMTWSPDRPGNWIFHCHFAVHLMPDSISAGPGDPHMRGMVGLILGVAVSDRRGSRAVAAPPARQLRLIAVMDSAGARGDRAGDDPPMHFVLEEKGQQVAPRATSISPEIDLTRGERVAITVVNRLDEPTSVHWHGIELEDSYVDGVPGVSGAGKHLAPEIAPGDSFVATFTPPRSGTFMYHAHVDEVREQRAGLIGALIVRDRGTTPSPDEHVFFLKGSRLGDPDRAPLEINGELTPDTIVLHAGRAARFRFLSLATAQPVPSVLLTARPDSSFAPVKDTMLVRWQPIAKDGFDLPPAALAPRLARQTVSIGETYDFEYTPPRPGSLRLEVRTNGGRLLRTVPIRVE